MNQKKLITILATITIIAMLSVSLFFTQFSAATATTYNTDNMTVNGVLASDSYVLFPYTKENLIFGFSKYGEVINGVGKVGLKYEGLDVFANPNVLEKDWSQGWFIDIHYADLENNYKRAWAFAMYSDLSGSTGIGGAWKEGCTAGPLGTPYGGRKTNVWATTDPIKVLYDGPRRFVALTKTTLYDTSTKTADDALVSVTITFVFDKDKKDVVLFKDIKRLATGKFGRTFQVEFSNRGEWDIGTTASPPSYAHFYDNLTTVYDYDYHDFYGAGYPITGFDMCQMIDEDGSYVGFAAFWPQLYGKLVDGTTHITRSTILSSLCTVTKNETWLSLGSPSNRIINIPGLGWPSSDPFPIGLGAVSDEPMVFKNKVLLTGGGVDYTWTGGTTDTITFTVEPLDTDYITVVYKHEVNAGVDDMVNHVGAGHEPDTPYVIGEWCFDLENKDHQRQFRAVTVYGLTDRHDADDDNTVAADRLPLGWSGGANVIDCEVQYLLDETFNPFDLYQAVEKQDLRWVDIRTLTTATSTITLTQGMDKTSFVGSNYNGSAEWFYGISHSKYWSAALILPTNRTYVDGAYVGVPYGDKLCTIGDLSFWYYKPSGYENVYPYFVLNIASNSSGIVDHWLVNAQIDNKTLNAWTEATPSGGLDRWMGQWALYGPDIGLPSSYQDWAFWKNSTLANMIVVDVVVDYGYSTPSHPSPASVVLIDDITINGYTHSLEDGKILPVVWDAYCTDAERVLVDGALIPRAATVSGDVFASWVSTTKRYQINFVTGAITFQQKVAGVWTTWTLPVGTHIKVLYSTMDEDEIGRYEWMVVGKDAATIDSAGAAYMTEAFDSKKDIEVLLTGLDINDTAQGPYAPFVMGRATTGTKTDYRDTLGRTFLRDDWCTKYPVSSSNMLFSGGPEANLGAEYFNEFTNAFFARTAYVVNDTGQAYKIFALSCWNRACYGSGYAVISVYKDLNGTIGFLIWGFKGQDTYYAAKWFWETGITYLQTENLGVTDIILKITYPTLDPTHPTFSRVQRLGTISEKTPHDP